MRAAKQETHLAIDDFRLVAAIMVIAIHTYPFASFWQTGDDLITLTLFRVAVPFFFMVSGYYLLGPYAKARTYLNERHLKAKTRQMLVLYGLVTLLYLPLSVMNGNLSPSMSLSAFLQGAFLNGFFYHLWYFPSWILGLWISKKMLDWWGLKRALIASGSLYVAGTLIETYNGILHQIPVLGGVADFILTIFGTTRDGLFLAPLFFLLGVVFYRKARLGFAKYLWLFVPLLLAEGWLVHAFQFAKHDAMYLMLPFVMLGLYEWLLSLRGRYLKNVRPLSLYMYVIHPWWIYLCYLATKMAGTQLNSMVQFVLIVVLSFLSAEIYVNWKKPKLKKRRRRGNGRRAEKVLHLDNLTDNLRQIQGLAPHSEVLAIVKANAYGHGDVAISRHLLAQGVRYFAVATLQEAIDLRKAGIGGEILILGYTPPSEATTVRYYDCIQAVVSYQHATELEKVIKGQPLRVHLKIDTGMHRLGMAAEETAPIVSCYKAPHLKVEGIFSHLGSADRLDALSVRRTRQQIDRFDKLLAFLRRQGIKPGLTHLQSSYGVLNYPELQYDMVRIGIFLYGSLSEVAQPGSRTLPLKPVLEIKATLIDQKRVAADEWIGYGANFQTKKATNIGIASIGYADGIPRELSQKGLQVKIGPQIYPVIGNICMDMLIIDLGDQKIEPQQTVTILFEPEKTASKLTTITNELFSRIGPRVELK
ncbi:alanine racemase [Listeria costaricensis]|uniref:alanine racemase n=1 Tax=Listeria costaricensis TaxID=2026604 RepID=UPI000C06F90B|nr:alanine racemase [Listeria costaricensis]